jgi:hypothetical protein
MNSADHDVKDEVAIAACTEVPKLRNAGLVAPHCLDLSITDQTSTVLNKKHRHSCVFSGSYAIKCMIISSQVKNMRLASRTVQAHS